MLIMDNHLLAKAFTGHPQPNHASTRSCYSGGGWTIFLMPGTMPVSYEDLQTRFNEQSLADLYTKSSAICRNVYDSTIGTSLIKLKDTVSIELKGVSKSAREGLSLLTPDVIVETNASKRSISQIATFSNYGSYTSDLTGNADLDIEFAQPVTLSHVEIPLSNTIPTIVAIDAEENEVSLGTPTEVSSLLYAYATPQTSSRFRIKVSVSGCSGVKLYSNVDTPPEGTIINPDWFVLAHTNTITMRDVWSSMNIPFLADRCSVEHPFTASIDILPNKDNFMYTSSLRFSRNSV